MWYDPNQTLSYNCLFNFVISGRGMGKTYGWTKKAITEFKKNGSEFVYARRYGSEFEAKGLDNFKNFFQKVKQEFPEDKLEVKGKQLIINGKIFGYGIPLTTSRNLKSSTFPNVKYIIFDEFIIDGGKLGYLKDEVTIFLDLYETIARTRNNVIAIFLSNALTVINPYFLYFNIRPDMSKEFIVYRNKDILIQRFEDKEFMEMKKNTRFGKMIDGTKYGQYSIENKFLLDNYDFIEKRSPNAHYYFTFVFGGERYGVWLDNSLGKFFVSESIDPSYKLNYSFTLQDHSPNTMLFHNLRQSVMLNNFIENFKIGNVRFENQKVKGISYEILKMVNL